MHTQGIMTVVFHDPQRPDVLDLRIDNWYIAMTPGGMGEGVDAANAERLMLCWNALANFTNDEIRACAGFAK